MNRQFPATAPGVAPGTPPDTRTAAAPHAFPRRILLSVVGLTPQVLTETLYALAVRPGGCGAPFVPTEIHVVTTREGRDRARLMLLDRDDGRFHQLCEDYDLDAGTIAFNDDSFHVVERDGVQLDDITDDADNTVVADTLSQLVRDLSADPHAAIHASLAGGRKTMGFYLGCALSLYGRPQDRLSHVLVNEPFSSAQEFYYPPAKPRRLVIRERPVHTSDARIMMADIPFVRLRDGLPQRLVNGHASFSETVSAAQRALEPPLLVVDSGRRRVTASGEELTLPPAEFAFYAFLARRRVAGCDFVEWRTPGIAKQYLHEYRLTTDELSGNLERVEQRLAGGADKAWFDERKAKVNALITRGLGESLGRIYGIASEGTRPDTRYGLRIDPEAILFRQ